VIRVIGFQHGLKKTTPAVVAEELTFTPGDGHPRVPSAPVAITDHARKVQVEGIAMVLSG